MGNQTKTTMGNNNKKISFQRNNFCKRMSSEAAFNTFYKDLKATEKADSVLTPKQQIDRLLRPGSTYRNLNPYEVLQIDPELPFDEVKKKYRRLSILVHPDKNPDNRE